MPAGCATTGSIRAATAVTGWATSSGSSPRPRRRRAESARRPPPDPRSGGCGRARQAATEPGRTQARNRTVPLGDRCAVGRALACRAASARPRRARPDRPADPGLARTWTTISATRSGPSAIAGDHRPRRVWELRDERLVPPPWPPRHDHGTAPAPRPAARPTASWAGAGRAPRTRLDDPTRPAPSPSSRLAGARDPAVLPGERAELAVAIPGRARAVGRPAHRRPTPRDPDRRGRGPGRRRRRRPRDHRRRRPSRATRSPTCSTAPRPCAGSPATSAAGSTSTGS